MEYIHLFLFIMMLLTNAYSEVILHSDEHVVSILWEPVEIQPNTLITFKLNFLNDTYVNYDFIVVKENEIIKEVRDSYAIDGKATHLVEFPSAGSFSIIINILESGNVKDTLKLDLKVAPEFPLGSIFVVVTLIAFAITFTRIMKAKD